MFPFRVEANRIEAHCHVRHIDNHRGAFIIVSALATSRGMSICNAFEDLAPQIVERLHLKELTAYFEYWGPFSYNEDDIKREEEFMLVTFAWDPDGSHPLAPGVGSFRHPRWTPRHRAEVEAIIGMELGKSPFES